MSRSRNPRLPRPAPPPDVHVEKYRAGHPQLLGYARVSKRQQRLESQLDQLGPAGCCRVFCEKVSGVAVHRPAFAALLDQVRRGDTIVVVRLDRLGRRPSEVIRVLEELTEQGVNVRDLKSGLDSGGALGKAFRLVILAYAEMERELNRERTLEGLHAARLRGRIGGKRSIVTPERIAMARHLRAQEPQPSTYQIAEAMHLSPTSVRKLLALGEQDDPRQLRLPE